MYGRDELEWDELTTQAIRFLSEQARLERLTSYTELNTVLARRTGYSAFDFGSDRDRAAMGQLLGDCVDRTFPEIKAMISSIVIYLNANDAGPGFYRLATTGNQYQKANGVGAGRPRPADNTPTSSDRGALR
jgi:hypothetical protein